MIRIRQQFVAIWIVVVISIFWIDVVNGSAFPVATRPIFVKCEHPLDVVKRLPTAVLDSSLKATTSYLETTALVIPIGLIWKIKDLWTFGWKAWGMEAVKMGMEWGVVSAIFSGNEKLVCRIRDVNDRYNQWIAGGICSAFNERSKGYIPMAKAFMTGIAFMYVFDLLQASLPNAETEPVQKGRQVLESAVTPKNIPNSRSISSNLNRGRTTSQYRVTAARRALRKGL